MAERSWWGRLLHALDGEYERRVRAASQVTEYSAAHAALHSSGDDEGEVAEIINLPRGARLRPGHSDDTPSGFDQPPGH
jgi:hypothetical protein